MKVQGIPGEYFAQCFIFENGIRNCGCYHPNKDHAIYVHSVLQCKIKWPVETMDGIAYVPSDEEMEDAH